MSLHDLRAEIDRLFGGRAKAALPSASSLSPTSAACRAAWTSFLIAVFCAIPIGMTCCAPAMVAIRTWRPTSPKTPDTPRSLKELRALWTWSCQPMWKKAKATCPSGLDVRVASIARSVLRKRLHRHLPKTDGRCLFATGAAQGWCSRNRA